MNYYELTINSVLELIKFYYTGKVGLEKPGSFSYFFGGSKLFEVSPLEFLFFGLSPSLQSLVNYPESILIHFLLISDILYNLFALYVSLIESNLKSLKDAVVV